LAQIRVEEPADLFHGPCAVAVVNGRVSGNRCTIDFDTKQAYEEFCDLAAATDLKELAELLVLVETPDGYHLHFRCTDLVGGNTKLARYLVEVPAGTKGTQQIDGNWQHIETKIETRGEGGYVIVPPTPPGCHPSGLPYRLLRGDLLQLPVITTEEYERLLKVCRALNEYSSASNGCSTSRTTCAADPPHRTRLGDIYNTQGDYATLLQREGWALVYEKNG
jgi:Bifunctional DNA primase/polymerase, N-terminal